MLLCILSAVCYLINHKCTMLLTFVCSIFNFFPVPNYVFLFSFVQPLCIAKISLPFQQHNCSQDRLSLLHVCPPGGNSPSFLCPLAPVWSGGSPCLLYRCHSGISFTIPSSLSCVMSSASWILYLPFSLFISLLQ